MKSHIVLYGLISLIIISCLADIGTFLYTFNNVAFEANIIVVLLKGLIGLVPAIVIVLLYKIAVNAAIIWALLCYRPDKEHIWAFMLTVSAIFAIILQFFGAYQNLSVTHIIEISEPGTVVPLTSQQSYSMWSFVYLWYLAFIAFEIASFLIYEKLYRN
jgi:hypothetical protein